MTASGKPRTRLASADRSTVEALLAALVRSLPALAAVAAAPVALLAAVALAATIALAVSAVPAVSAGLAVAAVLAAAAVLKAVAAITAAGAGVDDAPAEFAPVPLASADAALAACGYQA
jgi:hypothetical protein